MRSGGKELRFPDLICIGGDLGSGKSTVSKYIAGEIGYKRISTGDIQRRMAEEMCMTSLELNVFAETHPEVDHAIDARLMDLVGASKLVIDSRLAWFFLPDSCKIYLSVDIAEAAIRVTRDSSRTAEGYDSAKYAYESLHARRRSEDERYLNLYGADTSNLLNFNLVLDTTFARPSEVAAKLLSSLQEQKRDRTIVLAHPRRLTPTLDSFDDGHEGEPEVCYVNNQFLVARGHGICSEYLEAGEPWVQCAVISSIAQIEDEEVRTRVRVASDVARPLKWNA